MSIGFCVLALTVPVFGSVSREQLAEFFQPDRVQQATLSPDGHHVGYVVTESDAVHVVLRQVDDPEVKTMVRVDSLARAPGPVQVKQLRWAGDWLVYLLAMPDREQSWSEELRAIDSRNFRDRLLFKSSALAYRLQQEPLPTIRPPTLAGLNPDHAVKTPDVGSESGNPDIREAMAVLKEETWHRQTPTLPKVFFIPRHARVLASDAHLPIVSVEAYGESDNVDTDVFSYSLESLRLARQGDGGKRPGGERVLYDRAGEPRIRETDRSLYSRRQSFQVLELYPQPVWRSLDESLGRNVGFSHDDRRNYFGPRAVPLAFDADSGVLYVASNIDSNCFRIQRVDLRNRQVSELGVGDPDWDLAAPGAAFSDSGLVFDSAGRLAGVRIPGVLGTTRWISPGGKALQRAVEALFPGRRVDVLGWSDAGTRVLVLTSGPSDPGRYFIFYPGERPRAVELARRKAALPAEKLAVTRSFDFTTAAGVRLCGSVTLPDAPRRRPPPLVVLCPDIPGHGLVGTTYDPATHALAALGFMVLEVNHRGRAGLGTVHREAVRQGWDRVPLEDIRAAMAYVRRLEPFDVRRVALFGDGFGGYLALRALELYPNEFRTAVVVNVPLDLRRWATNDTPLCLLSGGSAAGRRAFFEADRDALTAAPSLDTATPLGNSVLLLRWSDDKGASALRSVLKRRRCDVDDITLSKAVERGDPAALAGAFLRIGGFLNGALFDYRVDVGKEEPVP